MDKFEKATKDHDDKYRLAFTIISVGSIALAYLAIPFTEESVFLAVIFFIVCQIGAYYFYKIMGPKRENFEEEKKEKNVRNDQTRT